MRGGFTGTTVRLGSTSLLQTGHHTASRSIVGNQLAPILPSYTQSSLSHAPIPVTAILSASPDPDLLPNWLAFPTFDPPLSPSRSPGSNLTEGPAVAPRPLISCSRGDWTTGILRTGQSSHGTTWFVHAGRSSPHVPTSMATAHLVETRQAYLDFDK